MLATDGGDMTADEMIQELDEGMCSHPLALAKAPQNTAEGARTPETTAALHKVAVVDRAPRDSGVTERWPIVGVPAAGGRWSVTAKVRSAVYKILGIKSRDLGAPRKYKPFKMVPEKPTMYILSSGTAAPGPEPSAECEEGRSSAPSTWAENIVAANVDQGRQAWGVSGHFLISEYERLETAISAEDGRGVLSLMEELGIVGQLRQQCDESTNDTIRLTAAALDIDDPAAPSVEMGFGEMVALGRCVCVKSAY